MPVADVADADRSTSVYTAVLTALEDEVKLLAGLKFPVPERLLANVDAMCAGQPLEVSASYVPKEARPLLETGRPMLQAEFPLRSGTHRGVPAAAAARYESRRPARPAARHRLKAPAWLKVDADQRIRHAFEIRHDSFRERDFVELLRHYDVALVCADTVEWPRLMDVTADFVYCRLHGSEELYASGYGGKALDDWAARIAAWARGGEPDDAERVGAESAEAPAQRISVFR